jgi:hypothetical protein
VVVREIRNTGSFPFGFAQGQDDNEKREVGLLPFDFAQGRSESQKSRGKCETQIPCGDDRKAGSRSFALLRMTYFCFRMTILGIVGKDEGRGLKSAP